jgi:hypothetical protein
MAESQLMRMYAGNLPGKITTVTVIVNSGLEQQYVVASPRVALVLNAPAGSICIASVLICERNNSKATQLGKAGRCAVKYDAVRTLNRRYCKPVSMASTHICRLFEISSPSPLPLRASST